MPKKETKKIDTAIIVAIIGVTGTIMAALLSSPLISEIFSNNSKEETINNPPIENGTIVFSNDFEQGQTSGFVFSNDQWNITKDKGNEVLELSGIGTESGIAFFGPNDFSNGSIKFRFNFRSFDSFLLNFRGELGVQTYTLYFSPGNNEISLGYSSAANDWEFESFDVNGFRPFQYGGETWYEVRLEVFGEQMIVWINDNKLISSSNSTLQQGSMEFVIQANGLVWIDDVEVREY